MEPFFPNQGFAPPPVNPWQQHVHAGGPQFGQAPLPQFIPDLNIPALQQNPLMAMAGQMGFQQLAGQFGGMPMQFFPQQSMYDQLRAKTFWAESRKATEAARAFDTETQVRMARGTAEMLGMNWDADKEALTRSGLRTADPFIDVLATMAPETFDAMHGSRGSSRVMAGGIHRGGRYAVDAATGRLGLSGGAAGAMTDFITRDFFGDAADLGDWKGLSAGRAGQLYEEMQYRGLVSGSSTDRKDQVMQMLQSGTPLFEIAAMKPGEFDAKAQQLDAQQVGNRLKSMAGAVSAMREIFGDAGNPNAPMREIVEGLQQLTQGGMSHLSPADLEKTVRTMHVVGQQSGLGLQGMMASVASAAQMTDQLGLDRSFAPALAADSAMWMRAHANRAGGFAAFGLDAPEKMAEFDKQLRAQAGGSSLVNQLGALSRMATSAADPNRPQTDLDRIVAAMRTGKTQWTDAAGKTRSMDLDRNEFLQLAGTAGVDEGTAVSLLQQKHTNQSHIVRYGFQNVGRDMQGETDGRNILAEASSSALMRIAPANIARELSGGVAQFMLDLDPATRTSESKTLAAVGKFVQTELAGKGIKLTDAEASTAADNIIGGADEMFLGRNGRTLQTNLAALDKETLKAQRARMSQVESEGRLRSLTAGIGQASPLSRISNMLQGGGGDFAKMFKDVFNIQDVDALRKRGLKSGELKNADAYAVELDAFLGMVREFEGGERLPPAERAAMQENLAKSMTALREGGGAATKEIERVMRENPRSYLRADGTRAAVTVADIISGDVKVPKELRDKIISLDAAASNGGLTALEATNPTVVSALEAAEKGRKGGMGELRMRERQMEREEAKAKAAGGSGNGMGVVAAAEWAKDAITGIWSRDTASKNPDETTVRPDTVRLAPGTTLTLVIDGQAHQAEVASYGSTPVVA